jgi:hypothetical protein
VSEALRTWLRAATVEERQELADAAASGSINSLEQYAGGHRQCSAEKAIAIEQAAAPITKRSKGRLPRVLRTDLSAACRGCEFARRCLGQAADASDFEPLKG